MNTRDIRLLYEYNRWANARVLAAASALSASQLMHDLASSYRSVFGTLGHILWGEWLWLGRWLECATSPGRSPLACADFPALRVRWSEVERDQAAFLDQLTDAALERRITYENPAGTRWTYPLGQMLQHLVNHSTYHRGQVTTMLRQLGAAPSATDFLVFIDVQGAPPGNAPGRGA